LAETFTPKEGKSDEPTLDLITYVEVEKANEPVSNALCPAVDELEASDLKPEELTVDTAYGGDSNHQYAMLPLKALNSCHLSLVMALLEQKKLSH
jgi:hypothetical protein